MGERDALDHARAALRVASITATAQRGATRAPADLYLTLHWANLDRPPLRLSGRERVVLGRAEDADCVISGSETSRHHAALCREDGTWRVEDLGSKNGTFLNGSRIERAVLTPAAVLRFGDAVAVVAVEDGHDAERRFREVSSGFFAGAKLQLLLESVRRAARGDLPILIEGETGVGKERVARFIHEASGRAGRYVAVNCAALPESLAEAELFGYRKGAFTGAQRDNAGQVRAADGGTLLLDEILDLPLALQAKLLRVIQEGQVTPLGDNVPVPIDVRVLGATQAPLADAVRAGRFRGDLFARLDGYSVRIPPLRERIEDVPALFRHFASSAGSRRIIEPRLFEVLCRYDWPFNVRELELLCRRLLALHGHEPMLRSEHLPERFEPSVRAGTSVHVSEADDEFSRFIDLLRIHRGVVARAAAGAGIPRPRAYRLMRERAVDLEAFREGDEVMP